MESIEFSGPVRVRITKLNGVQNESIHLGYCIEGFIESIAVGKSLFAIRELRNGVKALGIFNTSHVTSIDVSGESYIIKTESGSTYKIEDAPASESKLCN